MFILQVVHVGRNANNGTNAGTFYLNSNNDSSNRNRNIGRQHAGKCSQNLTPALTGKYVYPIQAGSGCERLGEHQR
jgi:hypothetical protein